MGLAEQTSVISAYLGCSVGIDTLQVFAQLSDGLAARLDPIVQILLALAERLDVLALLEAGDGVSVFEEDSRALIVGLQDAAQHHGGLLLCQHCHILQGERRRGGEGERGRGGEGERGRGGEGERGRGGEGERGRGK